MTESRITRSATPGSASNNVMRNQFGANGEVLSPADTVRVIAQPHPMRSARVEKDLPAGLSIAEIIARVCDKTKLQHLTLVHVDYVPVPAEWWPRVRPKAGTVVTVIRTVYHGDNPLRTILGLAIAVAAVVVTGGYAAPFLPAVLGSGVGAAILGAGIAPGGAVGFNVLFLKGEDAHDGD